MPKFRETIIEETLKKLRVNSANIPGEGTSTKIILDTRHGRSFSFSACDSIEIS